MKHRNAVIILANFWLAMGALVRRHGSEILIDDASGLYRRIDTTNGTITMEPVLGFATEHDSAPWTEPINQHLAAVINCWNVVIRRVIRDLLPADIDVYVSRLTTTDMMSERRGERVRALIAEIDRHRIDQMYLNRIPTIEVVS